jgi:hypothetical protein
LGRVGGFGCWLRIVAGAATDDVYGRSRQTLHLNTTSITGNLGIVATNQAQIKRLGQDGNGRN